MRGRWNVIALIASVALNVFLIGAAAGVIALGARMAHARPRPMLRRAAMSLAAPYRQAFLVTLRGRGQSVHAPVVAARALRRSAWASMSAANFDPAAAKSQLRQARLMDASSRGTVEDAVVDFAAALPPGERAKLGAALVRSMPSGQSPSRPGR
jgi:uncharacterized membrane protein